METKTQRKLTLIQGDSDDEVGEVMRMVRGRLKELRDMGEVPYLVALVGSNKQLPSIMRASIPITDLALCSASLQIDANYSLLDEYPDHEEGE